MLTVPFTLSRISIKSICNLQQCRQYHLIVNNSWNKFIYMVTRLWNLTTFSDVLLLQYNKNKKAKRLFRRRFFSVLYLAFWSKTTTSLIPPDESFLRWIDPWIPTPIPVIPASKSINPVQRVCVISHHCSKGTCLVVVTLTAHFPEDTSLATLAIHNIIAINIKSNAARIIRRSLIW